MTWHNGTDFLWTESTDTMRFPQAQLRKKCGKKMWCVCVEVHRTMGTCGVKVHFSNPIRKCLFVGNWSSKNPNAKLHGFHDFILPFISNFDILTPYGTANVSCNGIWH